MNVRQRIEYVMLHRDRIYTRERVDGRIQTVSLGELLQKNPPVAEMHINRFVSEPAPPYRALTDGERHEEINW